MTLPDHVQCWVHPPEDWRVYHYATRIERRCLGCRREASGYLTRNNGPRCRKGHLKTPWTWRHYGRNQVARCLACQYEKRRAIRQARTQEETAA